MVADFKKRFWISIIATIPILFLSPMLQAIFGISSQFKFEGSQYLLFGISSFIFFYGGWPFLKGFFTEITSKNPGMMTLIAVAISTAYFYSSAVVFGVSGKVFFWELATLVDIMLLGHWIEMKSVMGASKALEELAKLMPSTANKLNKDGSITEIKIEDIVNGDKLVIKPGEKIPADGEIKKGETSVNESMLTGESKPVSKKESDTVIGGSINSEGSITIEVKNTGKDSFLSKVIELVKNAQESKSKTQDTANRAAFWLTIIAISVGAITMFVWLVFAGKDFVFALERTVTVMVITCPHALGLAVPLVVAVSTAISAKKGLLIRNRAAFEAARNLNAVIFDKTGTLTEGKFGVSKIVGIDNSISDDQLLAYAASIETFSEHPIAKGITESFKGKLLDVDSFEAIAGKGAKGVIEKKEVMIVSPGYLKENNLSADTDKFDEMLKDSNTVVFMLIDNKIVGAIELGDNIKSESKKAVRILKEMGIKCIMITGDNKQVAKKVAEELDLDDYYAEVLPSQKADKVNEIKKQGLKVAMTGDGVNDAPALATADVGIAIGAGTDVAIETADIILVNSNPLDVVSIIKLAKATYKKMVQNLIWAAGYNIVAIPLAAGVLYNYGILLSPAAGALLMSISTVIVAINAKLLKVD
jgi:Cu2+-exporting ATPase